MDAGGEPELLWGLRGGGGNFGIVTAFEYDLHPVGPIVLGGPIFWPIDQAPQVLRFLREFAPTAPDELGIAIVAMLAPPMPFLPPERYGTPVFGAAAGVVRRHRRGHAGPGAAARRGDTDRRRRPPGSVPRPAVAARRQRSTRQLLVLEDRTGCPTCPTR